MEQVVTTNQLYLALRSITATKMNANKIVVSSQEPTSVFEGLIWIDTSIESITSAEGASF